MIRHSFTLVWFTVTPPWAVPGMYLSAHCDCRITRASISCNLRALQSIDTWWEIIRVCYCRRVMSPPRFQRGACMKHWAAREASPAHWERIHQSWESFKQLVRSAELFVWLLTYYNNLLVYLHYSPQICSNRKWDGNWLLMIWFTYTIVSVHHCTIVPMHHRTYVRLLYHCTYTIVPLNNKVPSRIICCRHQWHTALQYLIAQFSTMR